MNSGEFQDQIFGIVITLCKLYEGEGLTTKQAQETVADLLQNISNSLRTLQESTEN